MKSFSIFLLILFFTLPAYSQSVAVKIQHWKTKQDIDVYFVERSEVPIVDVRLVFSAGSMFDNKKWGLAYLTNAMLGEGTTQHSANQIAELLDNVGASFTTHVDRDMAFVSFRTLSKKKYFDKAFNIFNELVRSPSFSKSDFLRIQKQALASIASDQQNPIRVASNTYFQTLYKNTPYGHPTYGNSDSVSQLSVKDVKTFYSRYYTNKNVNIIIVGQVAQAHAKDIGERLSQTLLPGKRIQQPSLVPRVTPQQKKFVDFPSNQDTLILGQVGITRKAKNYFSLIVGNQILGIGSTSLLFDVLRNQHGLVYMVGSRFSPLQLRGPFYIVLQTRSAKTKDALRLTNQTLQSFLEQGPTQDSLNLAKRNIIYGFPLLVSSNKKILANLTNIVFYHLPLDYLNQYTKNIQKVTIQDVKHAFVKVIRPQYFTTVIVGKS